MKYIITILLIVFNTSLFSQNKTVFKSNSAGSGISGSLYSNTFNVKDFGALPDGVTDNAQYIQSAINAARSSGGGTVLIPTHLGKFATSQLLSYINVRIIGEGFATQGLMALSDTLIVIRSTSIDASQMPYATLMENIFIDGNSHAKIGFYIDGHNTIIANYRFNNCVFRAFSLQGVLLYNALVGLFDFCRFYSNATGISASGTSTLTKLRDCVWNYNAKWAINWSGGGQLLLDNPDMEANGASQDTLSGAVYYHNNTWPGGLHITGGWAEENLGTVFYIDANTSGSSNYPNVNYHSIIGFQDLGQQYVFTKRNIVIRGANQRLSLINSSFTGAVNNIIADGTGTAVTMFDVFNDATPSNITRNGATILKTSMITQ